MMLRPLVMQTQRHRAVHAADGDDAHLRGREALGHDRAAADVAADRRPDHPRQVPRRDRALRRDAAGHGADVSSCSPTATPTGSRSSTVYLGLFLLGGSFIAFGLFISSLTQNQIIAGVLTFVLLLMLLGRRLVGDFVSGRRRDGGVCSTCRSSSTSTTSPRACSTPSNRLLRERHHVRPVPDRASRGRRTVARVDRPCVEVALPTSSAGSASRWSVAAVAIRLDSAATGHAPSAPRARPASSACSLYVAQPVARHRPPRSPARGRPLRRARRRSACVVVLGLLVGHQLPGREVRTSAGT